MTKIADIIERCQGLYEDLDFTAVREWKAAEPGRKVIGYLPVYVPEELIHAAGMLPLGIMGGGDQLTVSLVPGATTVPSSRTLAAARLRSLLLVIEINLPKGTSRSR